MRNWNAGEKARGGSSQNLSPEEIAARAREQTMLHLEKRKQTLNNAASEKLCCCFDEKFSVHMQYLTPTVLLRVWRRSTSLFSGSLQIENYGNVYLPLDPSWNRRVCTWPLVSPDDPTVDVIRFLPKSSSSQLSLASFHVCPDSHL